MVRRSAGDARCVVVVTHEMQIALVRSRDVPRERTPRAPVANLQLASARPATRRRTLARGRDLDLILVHIEGREALQVGGGVGGVRVGWVTPSRRHARVAARQVAAEALSTRRRIPCCQPGNSLRWEP